MACSTLLRLGVQAARQYPRLSLACRNRFSFSSSPSALHVPSDAHQSSSSAAAVAGGSGASSRPKAVIFDLGGVVVPSPFPVFTQFEKQHNLDPGSVVNTIRKTGADGSFAKLERGELTVGEFSKPFSDEYHSIEGIEVAPENFKELLESMRSGRQVTAHSAVLEVIAKLQKFGVKTAILTNNFRYDDGHTLFPKDKLEVDVVNCVCVLCVCVCVCVASHFQSPVSDYTMHHSGNRIMC